MTPDCERVAWHGSPLLVLAPHPDDDILGCSRLMRRVIGGGGQLVVVWLTDGGASHGALPADARPSLVRRRRHEAMAGLRALGVVPLAMHFLGHRDGTLAEYMAEARTATEAICQRHGVQSVVVTDKDDGHPDHRAAYAIAMELSVPRVLSYPISARYDGAVYAPPVAALHIAAEPGDRKRAALLQHRSQMEAQAISPLSVATMDRFCTEPEIFIPVRTPGSKGSIIDAR